MVEESVESFILSYKPYAALAEVLPRTEGSPLLECVIGSKVLHLLERTNPYLSRPGRQRLIVNPTAHTLEPAAEARKQLEPVGLSRLRATGLVLERDLYVAVVDAGVMLVVDVTGELPEWLSPGGWVTLQSLAPVHGFLLPPEQRGARRAESEGDAL